MTDLERFFKDRSGAGSATQRWDQWKDTHRAKSTVKNYDRALHQFLKDHELESLDELYELALEAEKRGAEDPMAKYVVHDMIEDSVSRVLDRGLSGGSAKMVKNAVVKFLKLCGFKDFSMRLENGTVSTGSGGGSDIISPEGLRIVVDIIQDLQKKALVLTLKDSGLRISDVINLEYGDVKTAIDGMMDYYYLDRLTKKTGYRAQVVIGPEALRALRAWVRYRREQGETLEDDTPLFRRYRLRSGPKAKVDWEANLEIKSDIQLSRNSASNIVSRLFSKAGFPKVTAHGLRKYHASYLKLGEHKIESEMLARLQGRDIGNSFEDYIKFPPEALIDAYRKAYGSIAIYADEGREVKKLQEELSDVKQQLAELRALQSKAQTGAPEIRRDALLEAMEMVLGPEYDKTVEKARQDFQRRKALTEDRLGRTMTDEEYTEYLADERAKRRQQ